MEQNLLLINASGPEHEMLEARKPGSCALAFKLLAVRGGYL